MNKNYDPNKDYEQELIKIQKRILKEKGIDEDEVFDYAFGFTTAEECKEYPDCLKVFKVIYD
jgi:hypothetical protein